MRSSCALEAEALNCYQLVSNLHLIHPTHSGAHRLPYLAWCNARGRSEAQTGTYPVLPVCADALKPLTQHIQSAYLWKAHTPAACSLAV